MTPSSLVANYQSFGGTLSLHVQGRVDNILNVKGMFFFETLVTGC